MPRLNDDLGQSSMHEESNDDNIDCEKGIGSSTSVEKPHDADGKGATKGPFCCGGAAGSLTSKSFTFALRVTVALSAATLFTTLPPLSNPYPEPLWVFTTACVTSWLPSPDIATACKKTQQRILGTCVGATFGLATGFVSTLIPEQQALFLTLAISLATAAASFVARNRGLQANYSALLTQLTFGIVALSFYDDVDQPWKKGVFRMVNIIVGCMIGGMTAVLIRPVSVKTTLTKKVNEQMKLVGISAEEVLNLASASFSKQEQPERFVDIVRGGKNADAAYRASVAGLGLWKDCTALFGMLEYDPFYRGMSEAKRVRFRENLQQASARALLTQNSVVMMDSLIRGGVQHVDTRVETQELLTETGKRLRELLDLSENNPQKSLAAADELIHTWLPKIRKYAAALRRPSTSGTATAVDAVDRLHEAWTTFDEGTRPLLSLESGDQIVMFFDLLQHVILRSVRQHSFVTHDLHEH